MAGYVDGFLVRVPTAKLDAYKKMAKKAGKIWREHGALDFRECVADDMNIQGGVLPMNKAVKLRDGESLLFSFIIYKSKGDRNRINKKVMADPRMDQDMKDMPFDVRRMFMGGFQVIVG